MLYFIGILNEENAADDNNAKQINIDEDYRVKLLNFNTFELATRYLSLNYFRSIIILNRSYKNAFPATFAFI